MHILAWIVLGLIAGALASWIVPGRTPGGIIGATIIGILGGLLGGWILFALGVGTGYNWIGSIIVAVIGAAIILYVLRATSGSRGSRPQV